VTDCPFCGEAIDADAEKCPECGEVLFEDAPTGGGSGAPIALILIIVGVVLCVPIALIAAIAIPNLIEARKMGNETAAIGALKTIGSAQALFREADKEGDDIYDYGDLYELGQVNYLDTVLASGMKNGYLFDAQASSSTPEFLWFATAEPAKPGTTGDRYFATNHEGITYYSSSAPIPMNTTDCSMPADRLASGDIRIVGR
jgi:hypothetical protein